MNPVTESYMLSLLERIALALEAKIPFPPDATGHAGLGESGAEPREPEPKKAKAKTGP